MRKNSFLGWTQTEARKNLDILQPQTKEKRCFFGRKTPKLREKCGINPWDLAILFATELEIISMSETPVILRKNLCF